MTDDIPEGPAAGPCAPLPRPKDHPWRFRPALIAGRTNRFEGAGLHAAWVRLRTTFFGASAENLVRIGRDFRTAGLAIDVAGGHNRVEIADGVRFSGRISVRGFGLSVRVGPRTDAKRTRILACEADVTVGADCLIAAGVVARTSDMHPILDGASGQRLNPPRPVLVGDGVWIAGEVALMKGARVPDGCVVGYRATVTGAFDEPGCLLVGTPARILRRGIRWTR